MNKIEKHERGKTHLGGICNSPVILFLGAGASSPLGKWQMKEFTDNLIGALQKEPGYLKNTADIISDILSIKKEKDLEILLAEIAKIIKLNYFSTTPNSLIRAIDLTYRNYLEASRASVVTQRHSIQPTSSVLNDFNQLVSLMKTLQRYIRKMIIEHYRDIDEAKVVKLYSPLFAELQNKANILPVFTTNYDLAIENYAQATEMDLVNGFKLQSIQTGEMVWDQTNFQEVKRGSHKNTIALFKLHGSVNWYEQANEIKQIGFSIHHEEDEYLKNVIIYPSTEKVATKDPFFTAYDYLQRCLDGTRLAIFIGYSFRDYDSLTKIISALRYNAKLKIIVIDPRAKELIDINFRTYTDRFIALPYYFSETETKYVSEIKKELSAL